MKSDFAVVQADMDEAFDTFRAAIGKDRLNAIAQAQLNALRFNILDDVLLKDGKDIALMEEALLLDILHRHGWDILSWVQASSY